MALILQLFLCPSVAGHFLLTIIESAENSSLRGLILALVLQMHLRSTSQLYSSIRVAGLVVNLSIEMSGILAVLALIRP